MLSSRFSIVSNFRNYTVNVFKNPPVKYKYYKYHQQCKYVVLKLKKKNSLLLKLIFYNSFEVISVFVSLLNQITFTPNNFLDRLFSESLKKIKEYVGL